MTSARTVVFDLDGTLVDTAPDLINALNFVLEREGLSAVPFDAARNMIGAGARKLIERGLELDLRGHLADSLGQRQALDISGVGRLVIAFEMLEMVAEREQGEDQLAVIRIAGELDRPFQVLSRLLDVADPAEHSPEDAVGSAGGSRLTQLLGEAQGLLGGVDG